MKTIFQVLLFILLGFSAIGQSTGKVRVEFFAAENQQYGFDNYQSFEYVENYERIEFENSEPYFVPFKSIGYNKTDEIRFVIKHRKNIDFSTFRFKIGKQFLHLDTMTFQNDTITFQLPKRKENYALEVFYFSQLVGKLNVKVFSRKTENIIIVPLIKTVINKDSLEDYLNSIYIQAGLKFNVNVQPVFTTNDIDYSLLSNPSQANDRYT